MNDEWMATSFAHLLSLQKRSFLNESVENTAYPYSFEGYMESWPLAKNEEI